jgi:pyruvyltransferase
MPILVSVWFFDKVQNFGDLLSLFILNILGKSRNLLFIRAKDKEHADIIGIGSILDNIPACFSGHIWTSGSLHPTGKFVYDHTKVTLVAVRGRNTAAAYGLPAKVFGDGALLLGKLFKPYPSPRRWKIGIIPHYVDEGIVRSMRRLFRNKSVHLISAQTTPKNFMQQLLQCDCVFSSSLHGLISADAVGIPNRQFRVSTSTQIEGGMWKFMDYYSAFGINAPRKVIFLTAHTNLNKWSHITRRWYNRPNVENIQTELEQATLRMLDSFATKSS